MVLATPALLRRTIGAAIEVHTDIADETPIVDGEATLLQQAVLNLALNARDAIETGGGASKSPARGTISIAARSAGTGLGLPSVLGTIKNLGQHAIVFASWCREPLTNWMICRCPMQHDLSPNAPTRAQHRRTRLCQTSERVRKTR